MNAKTIEQKIDKIITETGNLIERYKFELNGGYFREFGYIEEGILCGLKKAVKNFKKLEENEKAIDFYGDLCGFLGTEDDECGNYGFEMCYLKNPNFIHLDFLEDNQSLTINVNLSDLVDGHDEENIQNYKAFDITISGTFEFSKNRIFI